MLLPPLLMLLGVLGQGDRAPAPGVSATEGAAERGYRLLVTKPYLRRDLSQQEFDRLPTVWPSPWKEKAVAANAQERRRLAESRYGLTPRPDDPLGPPLGYVDDGAGGWVMNCLACHGGKVAGKVIPGLGNSHFAFQTFAEDVLTLRTRAGVDVARDRLSLALLPLSRSNGATNAQVFSVALTYLRDANLELKSTRRFPSFSHHDLDAPPLWNTKKKRRLYIDGYVEKSPRVIMQFVLVPQNSGATIRAWEKDFSDVLAWIESLPAPRYPWPIDSKRAAQGRAVFEAHCAECHGTYGEKPGYPERTVPIHEVGTDPRRLTGITLEHRQFLCSSWLGEFGKIKVTIEPKGYVAPPLDGLWASAPYFHNGAVPTLWHVLHSQQRPIVWKRTEEGYDQRRVGLEIAEFTDVDARSADERRTFFDTRLPGKNAGGHLFPDPLSEAEKTDLLEYLKTL